jgi:hypothetical protein
MGQNVAVAMIKLGPIAVVIAQPMDAKQYLVTKPEKRKLPGFKPFNPVKK